MQRGSTRSGTMNVESAPQSQRRSFLWSRTAPLALAIIVATVAIDQLHKWWMLSVYDIESKGRVQIFSFFDITYVKNIGISYSLFNQESLLGQYLLTAFAVFASVCLWLWLNRSGASRLMAIGLALIIGGALGNAIDRATRGYVLDFIQFFVGDWHFAAFNVADMAITLGAGLMIVDLVMQSVRRPHGEA